MYLLYVGVAKIYSGSRSFGSAGFALLVVTDSLLLKDVEVLAVTLGKSDGGLLVSDNEAVSLSGGEGLAVGVLQMDDVEASQMSLEVEDLGNSTDVVTSSDEGKVAGLVAVPFDDLVVLEIELDGVVLVDFGVGESDGPAVVGHDVGDLIGSNSFALDLEELGLGLSLLDLDEGKPALDVVEHPVALVGLCDGEDVHNTHGELNVPSDFIIDFDASLFILNDGVCFTASHCDFEVVPAWINLYLRRIDKGRHSLSL